jgi:hypothetical protein
MCYKGTPGQVPAGLLQPAQIQHGRAQATEEAEDQEGHPGLRREEESSREYCAVINPPLSVWGVPRPHARSFSLSVCLPFLSSALCLCLLDIFVP